MEIIMLNERPLLSVVDLRIVVHPNSRHSNGVASEAQRTGGDASQTARHVRLRFIRVRGSNELTCELMMTTLG